MSYALDPHPTWTPDEVRMVIYDRLCEALDPSERGRIRTVDAAMYVPASIDEGMQACGGEQVGPLVQVVVVLVSGTDDGRGRTLRTLIPNRLPWSSIKQVTDQMVPTMMTALNQMVREERIARLGPGVFTDNAPVAVNDDA